MNFNLDQDQNYYNIDGEIDYLTTSIVSAEASILAKSQMGNALNKHYHDVEYIIPTRFDAVFYAIFF